MGNIADELSDLELRAMDGQSDAFSVFQNPDYQRLFGSPVQVLPIGLDGVDVDLARIVESIGGAHVRFEYVRHEVQSRLLERCRERGTPGWMALTVLFNGIYVGDASDILLVRRGAQPLDFGRMETTSVEYREGHTHIVHAKGDYKVPAKIGVKVAEIKFF